MLGSSNSTNTSSSDQGGRWVVAQFALMALIVVAGFLPPGWPDGVAPLFTALGAVLAVLGGIVVVWAWQTLGQRNAASPYPVPREGARLVEGGPYAFVRHPIYAAGMLFFIGFTLATSPTAFVPLVALAILWRNKAQLEEDYLQRRYHEYGEYRERVAGAFVPRSRAD
jgi:protein-S-isoprenylcysteine O-methyltransferase Ste14